MGGALPFQRVIASVLLVLLALASPRIVVAAGARCELPKVFGLIVEQRQMLDTRGPGLVVVQAPEASALQAGDVVRQANGRRATDCGDLEAVAADALAKGLLLLLAAEREGNLVVAGMRTSPEEPVPAAVAVAPVPIPPADSAPRPVPTREPAKAAVAAPTPSVMVTPVVVREAALPSRASASSELAAKAVAAAAVLGTVDEAARLAVPLQAYERRLADAKNAVTALRLEGEGSAEVRGVLAEAFGYHEAARDIRRYKAAELKDARVDQRGAGGVSLPYFSDSEVPRWVERYPFLSETLQQAPRSTHLLLPGEVAGRWNPDQAVELLWQRAAASAARLGDWAGGK